jgi:hypothetical protein
MNIKDEDRVSAVALVVESDSPAEAAAKASPVPVTEELPAADAAAGDAD